MIGIVYDKFGEDIVIEKQNDRYYSKPEVQISPIFWSWLTQFGDRLIMTEPQELINEYKEWIAYIKSI